MRLRAWLPTLALCVGTGCGGTDDIATGATGNGGSAGSAAGGPSSSGGQSTGSGGIGGRSAGGASASSSGGSGAGTSGNGGAVATGGASTRDAGIARPNDGATNDSSTGTNDSGRGAVGASLGTFQLTYYWVTAEDDFTGAKDATLYDDACTALAVVPQAFADSLAIEGTGRLSDGRVLNVTGACSCGAATQCYSVVDAQHPWGLGARGAALVPFRTIAVDRNVIALGSHVYVAELDGVTMPGDATYGQFVHDGCVVADDVGGGIVGKHIDFFSALEANYRILDAQLGLSSVTVYAGGQRCR